MSSEAESPLRLPIQNKLLNKLALRVAGLGPLIALYDAWLTANKRDDQPIAPQLLDFAFNYLDTKLQWVTDGDLQQLPDEGPVIVVANHPLGGLEGMLLARELLQKRSDIKVLTNELLLKFPEFADLFIGVDVLSKNAAQKNGKGIRAACRHLQRSGVLLIFPAGEVSGFSIKSCRIKDRRWSELVGHLAKKYRAACLPIRVRARNSIGFYAAGLIHRRLRTLLLPRELANKRGYTVLAQVGELVSPSEIGKMADATAVTQCLRLSTDLLTLRTQQDTGSRSTDSAEKIAADIRQEQLASQLEQLQSYRLLDHDVFSVYCAPYRELGCMMKQIAIVRERTFRAVDEGTGRELDSDRFDPWYWHLWIWDNSEQRIVGGYRVGRTDDIVRKHGLENLYSRSLYEFDQSFLDQLGSAVEVGRSFVTPEYQRHPRALDLLWRGIGSFMVKNPDYHTLFGCVSISKQYSVLARAFLADAMMTNFCVKQDWLSRVQPLAPLKVKGRRWSPEILESLNSIAIINKLLGNLDKGKHIPILLRHYLALNGRFASFSVNKGFNNSLDGLIIVDLRNTPAKYLTRYLGKNGSEEFMKKWNSNVKVA